MIIYTLKVAGGSRKPSARSWLIDRLAKQDRALASDVLNEGCAAGYRIGSLKKARERTPQIVSVKTGFPAQVWWRLDA